MGALRALLSLAVLVALNSHTELAGAAEPKGAVKVFILAGQSNMEGYGGDRTLDALGAHPTQGALLKKIRKDDGSFVARDDVFIFYKRGDGLIKAPLTFGQGAHKDRMGPELGFGIAMGDCFEEPVLLIKTAWGGKDLYYDFRPPSAGKPAYEIPGKPREMGAFYRKMVEEIHQCLDQLDTNFPQFKGKSYELCGFVWFQGWNDMCADQKIKQQVLDEYASNFANLIHDLRAEFKVPKLPVVVGEVGVDGENARPGSDMAKLRAGQAKIPSQPELAGTVGYVRTAPLWYPELDDLPRKLYSEEQRVRKKVMAEVKEELKDKPEASDPKKMEQRVNAAENKALATDEAYQRIKVEHDKHVSHWECHYQGSARVYALVGYSLGEAMKELLKKK